jgi:hypothetical protein
MNTIERIKTIAQAAVTWLVALAGVLTIVAAELADQLGADNVVVVWVLRAVVWLGVAVAIIRRSTPVLPDARGVLPQIGEPVTSNEKWLAEELEHQRSLFP